MIDTELYEVLNHLWKLEYIMKTICAFEYKYREIGRINATEIISRAILNQLGHWEKYQITLLLI